MDKPTDRRCLVAICHNWPMMFTKSALSLMQIGYGDRVQQAMARNGFGAVHFAAFSKSPRVDALRDMAAVAALRDGYSHILFLDADMIWPDDTLIRMLAHHDKGIVSGFYVQKYAPYYPIGLIGPVIPEEGGAQFYAHDKDWDPKDTALRPELVVGMGCTIIDVDVFRKIGDRPFFHYEDNADGWPMVSEDVPLCRKALAAGFGVWLDPAVRCGHAMVDVIDHRHWRRQMASEKHTESSAFKMRQTEGPPAGEDSKTPMDEVEGSAA